MVGLMAGHHLIARNTIQYSVHDRPHGTRRLPAALGLFAWKLDHGGAANVGVKFVVHDEHAAPHDLAGLADALQRAATKPEVHWGLALPNRARIAADEV